MDLLAVFFDLILHLDRHLAVLVADYGVWIYGILFLIVFCETGLVVTPFLPGDSLLFATGALAATGAMDPVLLVGLLVLASFLGDNTNYWIGRFVGPKVFHRPSSRLLNPKHLQETHRFYERHGGKAVILARFFPIIRTFAPFVAGVGSMLYPRFLAFSVVGAVAWVGGIVGGGYFFGNIPVIKQNFTLVVFGIIFLSMVPAFIGFLRHRRSV